MSEIPRFLAMMESGFDVVCGVRTRKQYSLYRKVISGGFNWAVALAWGKHFGDIGSLCMMRSALWKQITTTLTSAFAQAKRYIVAWRNGARMTTIPVEHLPRTTGNSSFESPRPALRALKDLIRFRLRGADRRELHPW